MRLQALIRDAVRSLLRFKLRSGLTMLGITIGIAAVVLVVAIGQAGRERAQDALQSLGDSFIWVEAGSRNIAGVRTGTHGTTSLTIEDAEAIRREIPLIKRLAPQIDGTITEAVVLGLAGGLVGILASWAAASSAGQALKWPITISVRAVAVAVVSSFSVGRFSGLYPAWRAASLDPIQALRHE